MTVSPEEAARWLRNVASEQLPFAISDALNQVAFGAQRMMRNKILPKRFTLRRRWVQTGIKVNKANKRQKPSIQAEVGSRDKFMVRQELGGTKRAKGRFMQIPTLQPRIGKSIRKVVPRQRWAGKLRGSSKHFSVKSRGGRTVFGRSGRGGKKVKAWFFLRRRVRMRGPGLTLRKSVTAFAAATFGPQFVRSVQKAFNTRKPR